MKELKYRLSLEVKLSTIQGYSTEDIIQFESSMQMPENGVVSINEGHLDTMVKLIGPSLNDLIKRHVAELAVNRLKVGEEGTP